MLSIIIPVYNEQEAIEETLRTLHDTMTNAKEDFEILAVNDASADNTGAILEKLDEELPYLRAFTNKVNRGYGASIMVGMRKAKGELFAITDADGTYPLQEFPKLLDIMKEKEADMVVGARTKKKVQIPLIRRPAKAVVNTLAKTLVGMKIPDLNSGMRIFTRELGEHFMHLYPQRFSFTITITLSALTNNYNVEFIPIDYYKRKGTSSLSSGFNGVRNFLLFLAIIIRITTYFSPLRFFAWPSIVLLLGGLGTMGYTVLTDSNISDAGILLFVTGIQIGLFGLLAEAMAIEHKRKL